jgi:hypothetical protein
MDTLELVRIRELEVAVRIWHPDAPRTVVAWHGLSSPVATIGSRRRG